MIRNPEAFARAFAASATADLLNPSIRRRRLPPGQLRALVMEDLRGDRPHPLFPHLRAFVRSQVAVEDAHRAGLAQDDTLSLIANLITNATNVASTYANQRLTTQTQTRLMELQTKSANLAQRALDMQAQNLNVQAAVAEGLPQTIANTVASARARTPIVGGIPVIPVAVGAGVLGLVGLYFILRKR